MSGGLRSGTTTIRHRWLKFLCVAALSSSHLAATTGPARAADLLYWGHFEVGAVRIDDGALSVVRSYRHPGIVNIVDADAGGGQVALVSLDPGAGGAPGGMRVQFLDLETGKRTRILTSANGHILSAGLSADGRRIALGICGTGGACGIEIRDLRTDERMNAVADLERHASVRWSPDGRYIAYGAADGRIAVYEVASGRARIVAAGHEPAWSPDGNRIAFATDRDIHVVGQDGGAASLLYRQPDDSGDILAPNIAWSPDGRYLSFNLPSDSTPGFNVCALLDLTSGRMRKISDNSAFCGPWLPPE